MAAYELRGLPYFLRGLLDVDDDITYDECWFCAFVSDSGRFLAALVDDDVAGQWEWQADRWVPLRWPGPDDVIEAYVVDTVEELEEIVTGVEIPDEVLAAFREEQQRWAAREAIR